MEPIQFSESALTQAKTNYFSFLKRNRRKHAEYSFTLSSDISPFSLCFAIFGYRLLNRLNEMVEDSEELAKKLKSNLITYRMERQKVSRLEFDKPFQQLLTFTLSSLSVLEQLSDDPLPEFVAPLLVKNIDQHLNAIGALHGKPGSGNMAMFMMIFFLHAQKYLGLNVQTHIDDWIELHLTSMNRNGFWGSPSNRPYLQFQNGYHQYEMFSYLKIDSPRLKEATRFVGKLVDSKGHYAPYPGGGGCFDYDAVFLLTMGSGFINKSLQQQLSLTVRTLLHDQNRDGGFAESKEIRPRNLSNVRAAVEHLVDSPLCALGERSRYVLTLLRPKHNRIITHWSRYSRNWQESDLWDSWFRMLTIANVQLTFDATCYSDWGFINYPGIGYHSSANKPLELD